LHPDYILEDLTLDQLNEWEAYNRIQPIGSWRQEFAIAQLTSIVTNLALSIYSKKGRQPKYTTPEDFIPDWTGIDWGEEINIQSTEEMKGFLMQLASIKHPKIDKKRNKDRPPKKGR